MAFDKRTNATLFNSDPEWTDLMKRLKISPLDVPKPLPPLDVLGARAVQAAEEGQWVSKHPLSSVVGYKSHLAHIPSRDGYPIEVKCYRSGRVAEDTPLPLLFVTHGGGWNRGTYVTEEAWLLWPLFTELDLCVVSVNYRLAPEVPWDTIVGDCWDTLEYIASPKGRELLKFDPKKVILASSSAGGVLTAILSHRARDAAAAATFPLSIKGVVLNVPVTCDPRSFPSEDYEFTSYEQCYGTLLTGAEMRQKWELVLPDIEDGKKSSPLLGDLKGLPQHAIYVAGQDPVRDEGIAYAKKLEAAGTEAKLRIYPGLPHTFGEFWDLKATKKWWGHLRQDIREMIE